MKSPPRVEDAAIPTTALAASLVPLLQSLPASAAEGDVASSALDAMSTLPLADEMIPVIQLSWIATLIGVVTGFALLQAQKLIDSRFDEV